MIRLLDIPKGSKLLGMKDLEGNPLVIIFDHIDGAYSYCYDQADPTRVAHFSCMMPLVAVEGGYEIKEEKK